jgi:predicted MPP superfamily phosphohydrolase
LIAFGTWEACSPPRVRNARIVLADWPPGARPLRLLLVSDIHVAGPDMSPARLHAIVGLLNQLRPDLVLLAGDFVSDKKLSNHKYPADQAIAPLRDLTAPLGVVAVLGNHDHWRGAGAVQEALAAAGVTVLSNRVVTRGPIAVGGVDDGFTGHADVGTTITMLRQARGARVLLTHSPDVLPNVPGDIGLVLAGHTHCGQIVLPVIGAPATASRFGTRYLCGLMRESGRTLIVTAGLGTSILPFRIGAPPDVWLIEVGGPGTGDPPSG